MSSAENLSPQVIQRIIKEIRQLSTSPPEGIRYLVSEDESNMSEIFVEIKGPESTPYEDGYFKMKLILTEGFPQSPPKGYFLTKIYHPNISNNGDICVNTLKRDWKAQLGIIHVLQVIRCLLIVPFPESSLNDEAGKLFMESYDEYARRARLMTSVHAPKVSSIVKNDDSAASSNVENIENGEGNATTLMKRKCVSKTKDKALKAVKKRGLRRL